jgi:hypothetical protein
MSIEKSTPNETFSATPVGVEWKEGWYVNLFFYKYLIPKGIFIFMFSQGHSGYKRIYLTSQLSVMSLEKL